MRGTVISYTLTPISQQPVDYRNNDVDFCPGWLLGVSCIWMGRSSQTFILFFGASGAMYFDGFHSRGSLIGAGRG